MKKRSDGRYKRQLYVGMKDIGKVDDNGDPVLVRDYVSVYGRSPQEVDEAFVQAKILHGKGIDIKSANDRFELWADRFIAHKEAAGLSAGHIDRLKANRKHLGVLNAYPISKINAGDVQAIIDKLSVWCDDKPPLAKKTLLGIKQTAHQIFKLAIASRVLEYNPVEYVVVPKTTRQEVRESIPKEQQQWVLDTDHRAQTAAMIMLYAGLRRGELLALTWSDVDLRASTIRVNKAVAMEGGRPVVKGHTKTEAGMRTVNMPKLLKSFLAQRKRASQHLYVVHAPDGSVLSSSGWRRMWQSYMAALNIIYGFTEKQKNELNLTSVHHPEKLEMRIKPFTAHQLRHTYITLLYLAGVDVLTARDQAGHSNIETTLQIYTHLDKQYKKKKMNKLDNYLKGSSAGQ